MNGNNGDNGEGSHPTPAEQKEILREERERDPETFDKKYGTDEPQESGDPHNN